jgi:hypothetical protein
MMRGQTPDSYQMERELIRRHGVFADVDGGAEVSSHGNSDSLLTYHNLETLGKRRWRLIE